jgi:hypothetical protein
VALEQQDEVLVKPLEYPPLQVEPPPWLVMLPQHEPVLLKPVVYPALQTLDVEEFCTYVGYDAHQLLASVTQNAMPVPPVVSTDVVALVPKVDDAIG